MLHSGFFVCVHTAYFFTFSFFLTICTFHCSVYNTLVSIIMHRNIFSGVSLGSAFNTGLNSTTSWLQGQSFDPSAIIPDIHINFQATWIKLSELRHCVSSVESSSSLLACDTLQTSYCFILFLSRMQYVLCCKHYTSNQFQTNPLFS